MKTLTETCIDPVVSSWRASRQEGRGGMNRACSAVAFALTHLLMLSDAHAALLTNFGPVASLRVEGNYASVGMAQTVGSCGDRYWIDLNAPGGSSAYATAMMAFATDANVHLRVNDAGAQVFGECGLHDIFMSK